jgi:hypothetical protein
MRGNIYTYKGPSEGWNENKFMCPEIIFLTFREADYCSDRINRGADNKESGRIWWAGYEEHSTIWRFLVPGIEYDPVFDT